MSSAHHPDAIERVARAMNDRDACMTGINTWEGINDYTKDEYRELARAALSAIDDLYADEGGEVPGE